MLSLDKPQRSEEGEDGETVRMSLKATARPALLCFDRAVCNEPR